MIEVIVETVVDVAGGDFVDGTFVTLFADDDEVVFEDVAAGIGDDDFAMKIIETHAEHVVRAMVLLRI